MGKNILIELDLEVVEKVKAEAKKERRAFKHQIAWIIEQSLKK